ncbi:hypothetical protein CG736_02800 [Kitasatospora sp. CB02891]|nr:hypothetical protein CG736_02800 [Kitasatospora sp. CB02891]
MQVGIVDEQAAGAQEPADGLGREVAVRLGQVVAVTPAEGLVGSESVAQDREGAHVLVQARLRPVAQPLGEVLHRRGGRTDQLLQATSAAARASCRACPTRAAGPESSPASERNRAQSVEDVLGACRGTGLL